MVDHKSTDPLFHIKGAKGSRVWGSDGVPLLDLTSGWNVVNAGWNNEEICSAFRASAADMSFKPPWTIHDSFIELKQRLASLLPGYSLIASCTGGEAIDNALKIARMVNGRSAVLSFAGAFHGSSTGAALASGYEVPHLDEIGLQAFRKSIPIPRDEHDMSGLSTLLRERDDIGVVVLETVATNAGCFVPSDHVLERISGLAHEFGVLVVCDEVGTGLNRTGTIFSFEKRPLVPDIVVLGKALTNGLYPLSLCLVRNALIRLIDTEAFVSTYAATPLGCSAALATLSFHDIHRLGMRVSKTAVALREQLESGLTDSPLVQGIHGRGLELAIHVSWNYARQLTPRTLLCRLRQRGIFATVSTGECHLMFMPPLITELADLTDAADIVIDALKE